MHPQYIEIVGKTDICIVWFKKTVWRLYSLEINLKTMLDFTKNIVLYVYSFCFPSRLYFEFVRKIVNFKICQGNLNLRGNYRELQNLESKLLSISCLWFQTQCCVSQYLIGINVVFQIFEQKIFSHHIFK